MIPAASWRLSGNLSTDTIGRTLSVGYQRMGLPRQNGSKELHDEQHVSPFDFIGKLIQISVDSKSSYALVIRHSSPTDQRIFRV